MTVKANLEFLMQFVTSWLDEAARSEEPDHDGSNGKGFLVETGNEWGHIDGSRYCICSIQPEWIMFGK